MVDVVAFDERYLGSLLEFSLKAAPGYFYSWAGDEELFRWKYDQQPVKLPDRTVPIWLAVSGSRIVGTRASMLGRYWILDREVVGAIGCDYYIEPDYRGTGVGKELVRYSVEQAPLRLNLNSSKASHSRHLSLGFREITGCSTYLAIRNVLSASRWLARRMIRGPGGRGTPQPIDRVRDWMTRQPGIEVLIGSRHAEVDAFLAQAQRRHEAAGLRDTAELLWRYREHPQRHGEVFTWHRDGQLAGVLALANQSRAGLHLLVLADLYMRDPSPRVIAEAWRLTRRACTAVAADGASVFGNSKLLKSIVQPGLLTYTRPHRCSIQLEGMPEELARASCYLSAGDGDYIC